MNDYEVGEGWQEMSKISMLGNVDILSEKRLLTCLSLDRVLGS